MIKNCFKIGEDLQLQSYDYESAIKELKAQYAKMWHCTITLKNWDGLIRMNIILDIEGEMKNRITKK